jgi:ADP-heptose:LPS heptosyltransferase
MIRSILVYSAGELSGDGLIKMPFIAGLRAAFSDAHITWCAANGNSVYDGWLRPVVFRFIDELILGAPALDAFRPMGPFGGRKFDLVIDTQTNLRRSLVGRRAGRSVISAAAGFALSNRRPAEVWPDSMVGQLESLLRLAAGPGASLQRPQLAPPEAVEAALMLLPPGEVYVGFAPGAGGLERRWPLDRYLQVATAQQDRGRRPVFLLGPAERDYIDPVRTRAPCALLPLESAAQANLAIQGPLLTIALAGRLSAAVAADAGPGHMLAAGGTPLVSLFCEHRKKRKFLPSGETVRPIVAESFGDKAIAAIPVAEVDRILEELLSSPKSSGVIIPQDF